MILKVDPAIAYLPCPICEEPVEIPITIEVDMVLTEPEGFIGLKLKVLSVNTQGTWDHQFNEHTIVKEENDE